LVFGAWFDPGGRAWSTEVSVGGLGLWSR
jgi:hypothetical protein